MYFRPKNGQNGEKRNFPDTTLSFDVLKQLSPVYDQVLDKSDVRFRRKWSKTWFLSENDQILDQKRAQKWRRYFLSEQKFSLTIFKQ